MTKEEYQIKDYNMKFYLYLALTLFSINTYSQNDMKKIITTTDAPAPVGPYNQAILTAVSYTHLTLPTILRV